MRLTWHYFAIITVIFSLILYFIAMSAKGLTGGDDGINFSAPSLFGAAGFSLANRTTQYYFILLTTIGCYLLIALVVRSPLGLRFAAVRENERRAQLIGINVYATRWLAFVLAGALAGVSGALFALFGRYASSIVVPSSSNSPAGHPSPMVRSSTLPLAWRMSSLRWDFAPEIVWPLRWIRGKRF